MKRKALLMLSLCLLSAALCSQAAAAQEGYAGGRVDFSIKALIPENQIDKRQSFFDLRVEPGQSQTLQVRVYNNASEPLVVDIAFNTASTNPGGVIDYSRPGVRDESMELAISELAQIAEPRLTIPPNDSSVAEINITMPDKRFDGALLGGVQIRKTVEENAASAANPGGIGIVNEYSYIVAVKLTQTDTPVAPELHLRKIEPSLVNYKTAVIATIQNSTASIIKGLDVQAEIYESGANAPLRESAQAGVDMAPNSVFEYAIDWNNTRIAPGDYVLHMTATRGEKVWEWTEAFTIKDEQAGEVNSGAIDLTNTSWLSGAAVYIACGAAVILLIFAVIYFVSRRKHGYAG